MTDTDYATRSEVAQLRREVASLRAIVGRLARCRAISDPDRAWLRQLLRAIDAASNGAVWALPDLAALALLPGNAALASAIAPHLGRHGGLRALGKALARCAGHVVDGLELRQVGSCRDGVVWTVQGGFQKPQTRADDCASDSTTGTIRSPQSCALRTP